MLAFIGAALGLAVAVSATLGATPAAGAELPRVGGIAIDVRILLYTIGLYSVVSLRSCAASSPALRSTRRMGRSLRLSTRTTTSTRQSVQWLLVGVLQIALSVTLLAGAGLLIRSIDAMSRAETGFAAERVLTLRVSGQYGVETNDATVQRINRLLDWPPLPIPELKAPP